MLRETALYAPVKAFLERLGYVCKGEVGGCDIVALAGDEPPVVVIAELKAAFNLELLLQAVDRARAGDEIWIAARLARKGRHGTAASATSAAGSASACSASAPTAASSRSSAPSLRRRAATPSAARG